MDKTCTKCGETKDESAFRFTNKKINRRRSQCKKCEREYDVLYEQKNKDKRAKYYKDNKKKICAKQKAYYQKNKEAIKTYLQKNKDHIRNRQKIYDENHYIRRWCTGAFYRHALDGYDMSFNVDELYDLATKSKICYYCGCELDWIYGHGHRANGPSLDRINNEKYISLDNCRIICKACNSGKYTMTEEEFIERCKQVVKRHGGTK